VLITYSAGYFTLRLKEMEGGVDDWEAVNSK
jgi:hypothetical protein